MFLFMNNTRTEKHFFCQIQAALKNCKKCHCVTYCSTEHEEDDRQEHSKSCQLLRTALTDFSQNNQNNAVVGLSKYWKPRPKILW